MGLICAIKEAGCLSDPAEISAIYYNETTLSFWIATQSLRGHTQIADLSSGAVIRDRDTFEAEQYELDDINIDKSKLKDLISVQPKFAEELKRHYISRIFTSNRFTDEALQFGIKRIRSSTNALGSCNQTSMKQSLLDKIKRLEIDELKAMIEDMRAI